MPRILAFTCSTQRPMLLRHCILQLQTQTLQADHSIYLNAKPTDHDDTQHYEPLLQNLSTKLTITTGPSQTQHNNYLAAIKSVPWQTYDLFLKIDDDDIYLPTYIEDVVKSYNASHWDFSGSHASGILNGPHFERNRIQHCLGLLPEDKALHVPSIMPGTYAFSKKAIAQLMTLQVPEDTTQWEDITWRRHLCQNPDIKVTVRDVSNYIYHIHGKNVSTAHHFKT